MNLYRIPTGRELFGLRVIWLALTASLFLYAFTLTQGAGPFGRLSAQQMFAFNETVDIGLATMAVIMLLFAQALSRLLWSRAAVHLPREATLADMARAYGAGFMIRMALIESAALFGFVIANLHHESDRALPFFLVAGILFGRSYPKESRIRRALGRD